MKMTALDKKIKRDRRRKYKVYKSVFKSRDIASKYFNETLTVSSILRYFREVNRYDLLLAKRGELRCDKLSIDIYDDFHDIHRFSKLVSSSNCDKGYKTLKPPRPPLPPLRPR
jgi:hypothetical protein